MELMDTSLDKFYRKVLDKGMTIPEDILGEIAVSVSGVGGGPSGSVLGRAGPPVWPPAVALQLGSCPWKPQVPPPWTGACSGDPGALEPHRFGRTRISGPSCAVPEF